jgi:hypothetical protein
MLTESSAASGTRKLENNWNQTLFKLKGNGGLKLQGSHIQDIFFNPRRQMEKVWISNMSKLWYVAKVLPAENIGRIKKLT